MTLEFVQIFNFLNNNDDLWGMENIPEFLYHQMLPEFLLLDLLLTPECAIRLQFSVLKGHVGICHHFASICLLPLTSELLNQMKQDLLGIILEVRRCRRIPIKFLSMDRGQ
jgi:hypothetical protein